MLRSQYFTFLPNLDPTSGGVGNVDDEIEQADDQVDDTFLGPRHDDEAQKESPLVMFDAVQNSAQGLLCRVSAVPLLRQESK
jgi:hypothetical protein